MISNQFHSSVAWMQLILIYRMAFMDNLARGGCFCCKNIVHILCSDHNFLHMHVRCRRTCANNCLPLVSSSIPARGWPGASVPDDRHHFSAPRNKSNAFFVFSRTFFLHFRAPMLWQRLILSPRPPLTTTRDTQQRADLGYWLLVW